jgi:hypothetical protein
MIGGMLKGSYGASIAFQDPKFKNIKYKRIEVAPSKEKANNGYIEFWRFTMKLHINQYDHSKIY